MCKINHFGFDKHPMFYYICDSFHDVCQVFIWQSQKYNLWQNPHFSWFLWTYGTCYSLKQVQKQAEKKAKQVDHLKNKHLL